MPQTFDLEAWRRQRANPPVEAEPSPEPSAEPGAIERLQQRLTDPNKRTGGWLDKLRGFAAGALDPLRGSPSLRQWGSEATPGVKEFQEGLTDPGSTGHVVRSEMLRNLPVIGPLLSQSGVELPKPVAGFMAGALENVGTKGSAALTAAGVVPGAGVVPSAVRAAAGIPQIIGGTRALLDENASAGQRAMGAGAAGLGLLGFRGAARGMAGSEAEEGVQAANRVLQERFPKPPKAEPIEYMGGPPTEKLTVKGRPSIDQPVESVEGPARVGVGRRGEPPAVQGSRYLDRLLGGVRRERTPGRVAGERVSTDTGPDDLTPMTESVGGSPVTPVPARTQPSLEVLDPHETRLNASGESEASMEALSRQRSMQARGEQYVVYDRLGQRKPQIGPEAVDYQVQQGETYGIEGPGGFKILDDAGGRVPATAKVPGVRQPTPSGVDTPTGDADVFDISPAAGAAPPKPRIPPKITALWQDLKPKWKASVEAQGPEGFVADPTEDLIPFAKRVMGEPNPRKLMGAERKVRASIDAEAKLNADPKGEAGFIDIDPSGLGEGLKKLPGQAERLGYFSMLAGPETQARNIAGGAGSVGIVGGLERVMHGDLGGLEAIKQYFSPETFNRVLGHFKNAPEMTSRGLPGRGTLAFPARVMHSFDQAGQDALTASGLSVKEAQQIMLTGEPLSDAGKGVVNLINQGGPLVRLFFPFARTGVNHAEQGAMRLPGIGIIASKLLDPSTSIGKILARQVLGTAFAGAGYVSGEETGEPGSRNLTVPMGAYGVPFAVGRALGVGAKKQQSGRRMALEASRAALESSPLPTEAWKVEKMIDPTQWPARLVPNLPGVNPSQYKQPGLLDPTLAKIPGLNAALLERKPEKRAGRARQTQRPRRESR